MNCDFYSNTKRAMEATALVQARELSEKGVYLNVVYPGGASTAMTQGVNISDTPWWMRPFWPFFKLFMQRDDGGKSAAKAARSSVWGATAPELQENSGLYFDTNCKPSTFPATVRDPENQQRVIALARSTPH